MCITYSFRNEFVLSELHGMKKRITLPQLTENGLVKRRDCSSGSIMARTWKVQHPTAFAMSLY